MIRNEMKYNRITVVSERFSGVNDFLSEYENKPVSELYALDCTATSLQDEAYSAGRADFAGVSGYTEALEQFRNGTNVNAVKTARAAAATGTKRAIVHSVNGGRVSVPSYLSGSPACMRRTARKPAKTELNIFVDMSVPSLISAEQVTEAGCKIVEYITRLESSYNVSLHAGTVTAMSSRYSSKIESSNVYVLGIKIKDAGKPFSAARVSFCLTSPAFQRVFSFIWRTRADGVPYDNGFGKSIAYNHIDYEREILKKIYKNTVTISVADVIQNGDSALPKL